MDVVDDTVVWWMWCCSTVDMLQWCWGSKELLNWDRGCKDEETESSGNFVWRGDGEECDEEKSVDMDKAMILGNKSDGGRWEL